MDFGLIVLLLSIGFVVGLSGAMIPGPLLVFVVSDTMKKGKISGPLTIAGHMLIEITLIAIIMLGIRPYIKSYEHWIFLFGGLMLAYMAYLLFKRKNRVPHPEPEKEMGKKSIGGSVAGGMAFSIFNPSFPIWWATAGYSLMAKGLSFLGVFGLALVVIGHWLADLGYYSFISYVVSKGRQKILEKLYSPLMIFLSLALFLLGVYFILQGATSIGFLWP